jgi:hypothetical protein
LAAKNPLPAFKGARRAAWHARRAKKINVLEEAKWLLGCAWMPHTTP